jgi:two-component system, sensor histidine kinase
MTGNTHVLETLMQASLNTPHVQFVQVQNRANEVLAHASNLPGPDQGTQVEVFQAPVRLQKSISGDYFLLNNSHDGCHAKITWGGSW